MNKDFIRNIKKVDLKKVKQVVVLTKIAEDEKTEQKKG